LSGHQSFEAFLAGIAELTELILNKNLIEKFDLRSPTLRVLELSENPLSQINNLICPQLVSFSAQPSDEAQSEQLIQVNGRVHCPQLLPEHVNGLAIDRAEYQKTYELAVEQNEQAQQIICEHRLSPLVFETYQIEDEELTQNLNTLLNSVSLKENFSTFRGITELNLSDLRLKTFPISLLQYFPELESLDLRGNAIDNLQDLEGYPNLIVAFDEPK
jgi:Leucine-rich repeat (LRR) protein